MKIGVIGAGIMGAGIAQVSAVAGHDVLLCDVALDRAQKGRDGIARQLQRQAAKGALSAADVEAALARITATEGTDALADADFVIEAATESVELKKKIFAGLKLGPDALLASNTSSISITGLAAATDRPERFIGLHFFNPVPVLPLVELVSTLVTGEAALARAEEFAGSVLGKQVVRCSDRSGFVVNALLVPYLLSAIRMVEAGFATVEDVDKAVVAGLSHPMGPLRLSDLVGLDTLKLIADKMYDEFKEPHYGSPPLLERMVEAGMLGKKAGRGFYTY